MKSVAANLIFPLLSTPAKFSSLKWPFWKSYFEVMQSSRLDTPLQEPNGTLVLKALKNNLVICNTVLRMLNGYAKSGKSAAA